MDKGDVDKSQDETTASSTTNPGAGDLEEPSNGTTAEEYIEEEYEEYADDPQAEEYPDEEFQDNGEDNFEISANEGADYGEGFEGQQEDMIEDVRTKIREMEEEAEKLRQLQSESEKSSRPSLSSQGTAGAANEVDKLEVDSRSVYVGQVDYSCTLDELEAHFRSCGTINRVTIMCDRFTGHPKGFAYIEFANKESVESAVAMTDSTLKDRQLKVVSKRTNQPGMSPFGRRSRRPFRGASYRGGRRGSAYRPYNPYYRGRSSYRGGFRGGFRRPRSRYTAY